MQLQMQRTSRCPSTTLRCVTITLRHISTSVYSLHWRIQEFDKGERGVMGRRDGCMYKDGAMARKRVRVLCMCGRHVHVFC